jgi:hypothetical protein
MIPFQSYSDPNLAYGFAATPSDQCGMCFELTFDGGFEHGSPNGTHTAVKGKKIIVMGSNMGGDVANGQFDLLLPGGGLGAFDSFTGQTGISKEALGKTFGGLFSACEDEVAASFGWNDGFWEKYKPCLTAKCESVFANHPTLKQGCLFHANWLEAVNNPTLTYKTVECPQLLKNIYSGMAPGGIDPNTPPILTYTLTISKNPPEGGTTAPLSGQSGIAAGEPFSISAIANGNYAFDKWIVTSGTAVFANADSASTTVTLSSDAAIVANFEPAGGIIHSAARASGRAKVSLTPAARGFAASLPAGHGYVGYSLIDLRGREIRSGKIGAGMTTLRFTNLNRSVMFLKLEGEAGSKLVLRAVTY